MHLGEKTSIFTLIIKIDFYVGYKKNVCTCKWEDSTIEKNSNLWYFLKNLCPFIALIIDEHKIVIGKWFQMVS